DVGPLQRALWAEGAGGLVRARCTIGSTPTAEQRGFELLSFLELFGPAGSPFPAREAGWPPSDAQADNSMFRIFIRASNATPEYRRTGQRFSVAGRRAARRRRCRPAWSAFRIVELPPG